MTNSRLLDLNVSSNELGEVTGLQVAEALKKNRSMRSLKIGFNPLGMRACTALLDILPTKGPLSYLGIENSWTQDPLLERTLRVREDLINNTGEKEDEGKIGESIEKEEEAGKEEEEGGGWQEQEEARNDLTSQQARALLKLVAQKRLSRSWATDPGRFVEVVVSCEEIVKARVRVTSNVQLFTPPPPPPPPPLPLLPPQLEYPRRIPEEGEWWDVEDTPQSAKLWNMESRRVSAAVVIQRAARERLIPWKAKTSMIFRDRARWANSGNILDTDISYSAAFTSDWNLLNFHDFREVISATEQGKCAKILRVQYRKLVQIFRHYSADDDGHSAFYLEKKSFLLMMEDGDVLDKYYSREIAEQVFTDSNFESSSDPTNPDEALMRHEFIRSILLTAIAKNYNKGVVSAPAALKLLLDRHLHLWFAQVDVKDSNDFRVEHLYKEDVDIVLEKHLKGLKRVFKVCCLGHRDSRCFSRASKHSLKAHNFGI